MGPVQFLCAFVSILAFIFEANICVKKSTSFFPFFSFRYFNEIKQYFTKTCKITTETVYWKQISINRIMATAARNKKE